MAGEAARAATEIDAGERCRGCGTARPDEDRADPDGNDSGEQAQPFSATWPGVLEALKRMVESR